MITTLRLEVHPLNFQNLTHLAQSVKEYLKCDIQGLYCAQVYWVCSNESLNALSEQIIEQEILHDSVIEKLITTHQNMNLDFDACIQVRFKPGVTDNKASSVKEALKLVSSIKELQVFTGVQYFIKGDLSASQLENIANEFLGNKLLNQFEIVNKVNFNETRFTNMKLPIVNIQAKPVEKINLNDEISNLLNISEERCWALTQEELEQIQQYFMDEKTRNLRKKYGLEDFATDVEMEIIAQSWSEHCKHKIFAANISYQEDNLGARQAIGNKKIQSLYKTYIKQATFDVIEKNNLDWPISVFSDNAGIVRFDKNVDVCIKVETHNSPSALDPYGGALTGILGVNRDILGCGIGARPIANTDVFCFAHENLMKENIDLPQGLKHPKRILEGVHKGVEDGGNKSGIPTVNGSLFFDDDYAGKPLVFVGTVGVMPQKTSHYQSSGEKNQKVHDRIVMVGGRIGADGIHGATMSSLELNEHSPATAVQIGDPLTQKKVMDFMLEARKQGLYTSVTDNGAGGLSSSVGEMATVTSGARIDLKLAPTKYPGLSAYELMISESQERMTFAVAPNKIFEFIQLAKNFGVEATDLGEFTNTGLLEVYYGDQLVSALHLDFLHEALKPMELVAHYDPTSVQTPNQKWHEQDFRLELPSDTLTIIHAILNRPNVASKENLVRFYDHEVQAATVVKPFMGPKQDGPSDAAVIWLHPHGGEEKKGIIIGHGLQPLTSHYDTYQMTVESIDEAVRNVVATGANPNKIALLDNYCWPDPVVSSKNPDGPYKLGQLVRSAQALYDTAIAYQMPFVSGKDSMKNDYSGFNKNNERVKISVPPTLLITALGMTDDVEKICTTPFKNAYDHIFLIGARETQKINNSELTRCYKLDADDGAPIDLALNAKIYQCIYQLIQNNVIESCHDISEGGLIGAVIESCIGGKLGCKINLDSFSTLPILFNEGTGQFIISVAPNNLNSFNNIIAELPVLELGVVTSQYSLHLTTNEEVIECPMTKLEASWKNSKELSNE
jgi:phosphoribosylformylglycinamidine synthase subunit PurSL